MLRRSVALANGTAADSADDLKDVCGDPVCEHAAEGLKNAMDTAAARIPQVRGNTKAAAVSVILTANPDPVSEDSGYRCVIASPTNWMSLTVAHCSASTS
jgi:hypothetical protein